MALDRPFDDGRVKTANVPLSASTVSANIMVDSMFMFTGKRTLYCRRFRLHEAAETGVLTSEEDRRASHKLRQHELKLGKRG